MTDFGANEEKPLEKQGLTGVRGGLARGRADCEEHGKWQMENGERGTGKKGGGGGLVYECSFARVRGLCAHSLKTSGAGENTRPGAKARSLGRAIHRPKGRCSHRARLWRDAQARSLRRRSGQAPGPHKLIRFYTSTWPARTPALQATYSEARRKAIQLLVRPASFSGMISASGKRAATSRRESRSIP